MTQKTGHGWLLTSSMSAFALACGFMGGLLVDGMNDDLAAYNAKNRPAVIAAPMVPLTDEGIEQSSSNEPAWFPENNKIEWSLSLPPGATPIQLNIDNNSASKNHRLTFYSLDGQSPRQAATIYIRASHQAMIHLPAGRYRVDVASTPVSLEWNIAQGAPAIPLHAIALKESEDDAPEQNKISISEDGKISSAPTKSMVVKPTKAAKPKPKNSDDDAVDPTLSAATEVLEP